jgi:hypothetical protein
MITHAEVIARSYQTDQRKVILYNFRSINDRKEAEARIRYMALHDALTGLPNRTLLTDRLGQAVAYARRARGKVAVMMLTSIISNISMTHWVITWAICCCKPWRIDCAPVCANAIRRPGWAGMNL